MGTTLINMNAVLEEIRRVIINGTLY